MRLLHAWLSCGLFLWLAAPAGAAEPLIDHRFATPRSETILARLPIGHYAVVTPDGGLRYADGAQLRVSIAGDLAPPPTAPTTQKLLGFVCPIVVTTRQTDKVSLELTAFATAPGAPPMDCLRVALRNKTAEPLQPILRVQADRAQATLPAPQAGFQRDGEILVLCEVREGKAEVIGVARPKQHVFRRQGGQALPNWGKPKVPCDAGFRNIVAGMKEPATYFLKAEPDKRYLVAIGLCESHWQSSGNRILDLLIEGKKVATVDPVKKPYGTDVPFVLTFPATDANRDGWIEVTSVANPTSPDVNSIINVIWLFEEAVGKELPPADILAGKANDQVHCYVDCGGGVETPGPTSLDYKVELPPNGSATLWLKKPHHPTKAGDAAKLSAADPAELLSGAQIAWANAHSNVPTIQLSDATFIFLLRASHINLLALLSQDPAGMTLSPSPFATDFSPRTAAYGATALDGLGAHAEATAVLASLVARRGDDGLWHEGADPWTATGHALWALVAHYELTGDKGWLDANYRTIVGAADALIRARELTKWIAHDPQSNRHGLMPVASYRNLPSDNWLVHAFWAWQGLSSAARAARALERAADIAWLEDSLDDFTRTIRQSLAQSKATGAPAGCLPAVPDETPLWTFAGCLAAVYPSQVLPADDKLVEATFRYLEAKAVEGLPGGLDGQSPVLDLPLACDYALACLARGERDRGLAAFVTIANTASPTGGFPEAIDPKARRATSLAPSAASAAGYILLLRNMLVAERGDELHLFPCVPKAWLAQGISVANLPTRFGPLSFSATLSADGRKLVLEPKLQARRAPKALVVHCPLPSRAAKSLDWREGRLEINLD